VGVGQTVAPAYLSQHVTELPPKARVLEAVQDVARVARIGNQDISASSLAERFGFTANRQWTPVGDLSGGERRRLQLLRLLMAEPNVLLLDEPTNDLDIDTLTALEDLLDSFPGTVLVVSHDRYFVDRVTDKVVALLGDGSLAELPGGVEEYLARRAAGGAPLTTAAGAATRPVGAPVAGPAVSAADSRAAKKEASRLERRMLKLDADEKRLLEQLAAAASDYAKAAELDTQLRAVQAEKDQVETDWLAAAEIAEG
jgi:ATP-binding cassette subfamily F protein uup